MAVAARRFVGPIVAFLIAGGLEVSGYEDIRVAIGLWAFAGIWGLLALFTWKPVRYALGKLRRLRLVIEPLESTESPIIYRYQKEKDELQELGKKLEHADNRNRSSETILADDSRKMSKERIFNEGLLLVLTDLGKSSPTTMADALNNMSTSDDQRVSVVKRLIQDANSEVLLICYSLTSWKDAIEKHIRQFLEKKPGVFKVLMLLPDSNGLLEKSALEAFRHDPRLPTKLDVWVHDTITTRKAHRSDISSGVDMLTKWQQLYGKEKVLFRFYSDTPVLYGFSFDRKVFYISSYFINPIERGFTLPFKAVYKDSDPISAMVASVFLNWFDVKFATGPDQLETGDKK